MFRILMVALAILVTPASAAAQSDPMEQQRCVWSCLANSPGNTSPEYHQCVRTYCAGEDVTAQRTATGTGAWSSGLASDGFTRFAGLATPDGTGRGVYYMCNPRGDSYLMLFAMDARPGMFQLVIDGRGYRMPFDRSRQQLTVPMQPHSEVLYQLAGGTWLSVIDSAGVQRMQMGLAGAANAIAVARSACGY